MSERDRWETRRGEWNLADDVTHVCHGSFGATPRIVLSAQASWRERIESAPDAFFSYELRPLLRARRSLLARRFGADEDGLVLMPNASAAVSTVLRSLRIGPGRKVVCTNHAYASVQQGLAHVARTRGVEIAVVDVPFPPFDPAALCEAVEAEIDARTDLLVVDHVTSPTGLVFPVSELVAVAHARGVRVLVDGAHAPGALPLDLRALGADFYAGNLHKWMCSAKGCAFLYVDAAARDEIHPLTVTLCEGEFWQRFEWPGTCDAAPWLSIDTTCAFFDSLEPDELRDRNRRLALRARALLADTMRVELPTSDDHAHITSMAALRYPFSGARTYEELIALRKRFFDEHKIEVAFNMLRAGEVWIRLSVHAYNSWDDYLRLDECVRAEAARSKGGS